MVLVAPYNTVGSTDNVLRAAIVAFQLEETRVGVLLVEVEDIVDVCTAKAVNALCIVAHYTNAAVGLVGQKCDDAVLSVVRVLIFIYKNVAETLLVALAHVLVVAKEQKRIDQQVVEIHCVRLFQHALVFSINASALSNVVSLVALVAFGVALVGFG